MNFLNKMRITHKLVAILIIVLFGFALIGLAYNYLLGVNKDATESTEKLTSLGSYVDKVEIDLLEARRIEKDFAINRKMELVDQFELKMTDARKNLAIITGLAPEGMNRTTLESVQDLFRNYHSSFYGVAEALVALGLTEEEGIQGQMRKTAHNLELAIRENGNDALLASMLQMRRHEKDYISRENAKYISRMDEEYESFRSELRRSGVGAAGKILKEAEAYLDTFRNYAGMAQEKTQQEIATQNTINLLQPLFRKLIQDKDVVLEANKEAVSNEQSLITGVFTTILIVTGLMMAVVLLIFARSITTPLAKMREAVGKVAAGDFGVRVGLKSHDELGALSKAFDNLLDDRLAALAQAEKENEQLNDSIIDVLESVSRLSDKDLSVLVPVNEDITGPVADAMNLMTSETARVLTGIRQVSEEVQQVADLVKQQSDKVTNVAASERSVVETAIEKLEAASKAMNEVAGLAQVCNDTATLAANSTMAAFQTVTSTVDGMHDIRETISETEKRIKRLGERSQEITTVVDIIKDIAERTHGLALNASMQAAAAGDAGRGFAVVADEVQRLAESSRNSTAQITSLVRSIQSETSETMSTMNRAISQVVEGSGLAERAGKQMQETQKTTSELVQSVLQIAQLSLEQAKAHEDLKNDTAAIRNSTSETGRELEEQSRHTDQLVDYAKLLKESVHVFKLPEAANQ